MEAGERVQGSTALVGEPSERLGRLLCLICTSAVPNVVSFFLMLIPETVNMLSISHTESEAAVAAIGLGNMVQNCFGLSVGVGLTGALDTLVSQATGRGDRQLSTEYLQRGRIIVTLQLVWMVPLLCLSHHWLLMLQQPPEVSELAADYNRAAVIGLVGMFQFEANQVFMRNQGWPQGTTVVVAVTTVLHLVWCWLFIWHMRLGNTGAGWANTVTGWLQCAASYGYLLWAAPRMGLSRKSLVTLTASAFRGWQEYLRVALPNTLVLCSDWWVGEVLTVIVGWLGPEAQAAHNSVGNLQGLLLLPIGVGMRFTAAFLVGSALGEGRPQKARRLARICTCLAGAYWAAVGLLLFVFADIVARFYFPQEAHGGTRATMEVLIRTFAIAGVCQTLQIVMAGVLAGLGKQALGAKVYLFSNWLVMLPLTLIFGFVLGWGVQGVWCACVVGPAVSTVGLGAVLLRLSFEELAVEAAKHRHDGPRVRGEPEPQPAASRSLSCTSSGSQGVMPPLVRSSSQGLCYRQTTPTGPQE